MPPVPFEFETEQLNGNSATKQSLNCYSAIQEKSVKQLNGIWLFDQLYPNLMNGNSVTVLSPNNHSAI